MTHITLQYLFKDIHGSSFSKVKWILNKPITNRCNRDGVLVVVAEL